MASCLLHWTTSIAGEIPSDDILKELSKSLLPPGLFPSDTDGIKIPQEIRQTIADIVSPPAEALADAGILPVMNQLIYGLEQVPLLIDEVRVVWYKSICRCSSYSIFW